MVDDIRKKFIDSLIEAEKLWQGADHIAYITYPFVKNPKLLIRALEALHKSLVLSVSTILKFEYLHKRIELSGDTKKNLEVFFKKCSVKYGLNELDSSLINEIMLLGKKHNESGFEFSKFGKVIILDDDQEIFELNIEKIKTFLALTKKLLENTNRNFRAGF